MKTIGLQVARWGNSLAVRLPAAYAKRAGIRDGDALVLAEAPDGTLSIKPQRSFDRRAFSEQLQKRNADMPMGTSVIEKVRNGRY